MTPEKKILLYARRLLFFAGPLLYIMQWLREVGSCVRRNPFAGRSSACSNGAHDEVNVAHAAHRRSDDGTPSSLNGDGLSVHSHSPAASSSAPGVEAAARGDGVSSHVDPHSADSDRHNSVVLAMPVSASAGAAAPVEDSPSPSPLSASVPSVQGQPGASGLCREPMATSSTTGARTPAVPQRPQCQQRQQTRRCRRGRSTRKQVHLLLNQDQ